MSPGSGQGDRSTTCGEGLRSPSESCHGCLPPHIMCLGRFSEVVEKVKYLSIFLSSQTYTSKHSRKLSSFITLPFCTLLGIKTSSRVLYSFLKVWENRFFGSGSLEGPVDFCGLELDLRCSTCLPLSITVGSLATSPC